MTPSPVTPSTPIPLHAQILVVGGGPAGSYAASLLVREGFDVVLLEASKFPRYHVGESLLPSVRNFLRFIDADEKVANHGFKWKPGGAIKFNQYKKEAYTDFVAAGHDNASWNVVRSEFDHILLEHAASLGATVYDNTKVVSLEFDENAKPVSAAYVYHPSCDPKHSVEGTITFDYLVDATGRAGLMSTKYLKNRNVIDSLKNIAVWGYWSGVGTYGEGTTRAGAPFFEALTDESGWAWFIPLHKGVTSVGVVVNKEIYTQRAKSRPERSAGGTHVGNGTSENLESTRSTIFQTLGGYLGLFRRAPQLVPSGTSPSTQQYLETLDLAPGLKELLGDGKLVPHLGTENGNSKLVHTASDYSYSAERYSGNGWRVIGDAGAFIDPFFSSGIHLALTGALSAAITISASIRGDCNEKEAAGWHTERVGTSFTRFLVVVLSAYKQIRSQSTDILSDIDEDNFDRAFKFFRPVIQGGSDMGHRLSEDELQEALDFCGNLFAPSNPEEHLAAERFLAVRFEGQATDKPGLEISNLKFLDVQAPVIHPQIIETVVRGQPDSAFDTADSRSDAKNDSEGKGLDMRMILKRVNARRTIHHDQGNGMNAFEVEPLGESDTGGGWVARLERGRLGLIHVDG